MARPMAAWSWEQVRDAKEGDGGGGGGTAPWAML